MIQDVLEVVHSTTMLPDLEGYVVSQANPIGEPSYYYYSPIEARAPAPRVRRAAPRALLKQEVEEDDMPGLKSVPRPICFQNRNLMLTYKTHLNKALYKDWFKGVVKEYAAPRTKILFLELAHETGDKHNPYLHTHVYFELSQPLISRRQRALDYDSIHPNWNYVTKKPHMLHCKKYLMKEDPENKDLIEEEEDDQVWKSVALEHATPKEMLLNTRCKPNEVSGLLAFHAMCRETEVRPSLGVEHMLRWQKSVIEIMDKNSIPKGLIPVISDPGEGTDDPECPIPGLDKLYFSLSERFLHVVYDPKGGSGKTALIKALVYSDPKRFFAVQTIPQSRDFATIVQGALDSGWTGDTLLFNMPKQQEEHQIHTTIESAVDAFVTSTKYQGKTMFWETHNVWIFTNVIPNPHKVALDRWRYYSVSADFSKNIMSTLRLMSLEEGINIYEQQQLAREEKDVMKERVKYERRFRDKYRD